MGPKISVDSATLMNKGLEVIEAHHLFDVPGARIDVLVHPQSLVHSLVEFVDGSTLAQLGLPDMRTALAVGLCAGRERIASGVAGLDLLAHGRLDFEAPDLQAFPCLRLAYAGTATRRQRAGRVERGQRSSGFSLSSGPDRFPIHPRAGRRGAAAHVALQPPTRSMPCSTPTRPRARRPATPFHANMTAGKVNA